MKKQLALVTAVALAATSLSRPAQAYNWSTHSRMAEMAVVTMQSIDPIVFPPQAWSDEQKKQFEQFTAAVRSAPQRLEVLKSGLPLSSEEAVKLPFTPADGDLPIERYPYQTVESSKLCAYYDDLNLGAIDRFRIKDMVHVPVRPGGVCGMRIPQDQSCPR